MKNIKRFISILLVLALFAVSCIVLFACDKKDVDNTPAFLKASESADGYATVYMGYTRIKTQKR